jgi:FdhD protein
MASSTNSIKSSPVIAGSSVIAWERATAESTRCEDFVTIEEPLEIRVDTRTVAITMRTPGHDEELAAGFLLSEGVISDPDDIESIQRHPATSRVNTIDVFTRPDIQVDFARLTRHVFAASSCGLCGKTAIDAIEQSFPPIRSTARLHANRILDMANKLGPAQSDFARTGGLHAAAVFDVSGGLKRIREDIGRHNAVDKVVGRSFLQREKIGEDRILFVSGRTSFEIVQKALAGKFTIVAAVSAPSSLAIDFAERSGITLLGFVRDGRMNVYTQTQRIEF